MPLYRLLGRSFDVLGGPRGGRPGRLFCAGIACCLLATPAGAAVQQPGKAARVGLLRPAPDDRDFRRNFDGFLQALRESGYVEGTNLTLEYRVRPGGPQEMVALAEELVG